MEECIMSMAEQSKVLFVTNYGSANELNLAFDHALVKLKKMNADRDLQVEVLCICREYMHFINSIYKPDTFEYALRQGSKLWLPPKMNDIKLRHTFDNKFNVSKPQTSHDWSLLTNATH